MLNLNSIPDIATACARRRFLNAEFMYKPPPSEPRSRLVFEYALRSRLAELSSEDAVLFICHSAATVEGLAVIAAGFRHLHMMATIANPEPAPDSNPQLPAQLEWEGRWQRYQMTDRWWRIGVAMEVARRIDAPGYLIMPALDAVWGMGLLSTLVRFSQKHSRGGQPAAVSPYTYYQHSSVAGAEIPPLVINVLNTALGHDLRFAERLARDEVQGFWGKMGMIPFGMCGAVIDAANRSMFEDDLEIDRVLRELGYSARALWIDDPTVYRQALPVFDMDGVRTIIERTMHYSLYVPASEVGGSTLNFPLDEAGERKRQTDPQFARYNEIAEKLIAECAETIKARLDRFGASWVDWGQYRHVVRMGIPGVEVWRRMDDL
jgi:hypothetical protein